MDEQHIQALVDKVLAGSATELEKKEITEWYESRNETQQIWESDFADEERIVEERMLLKLQKHMDSTKPRIRLMRPGLLLKVAAIFIVAIMVSAYFYIRNSPGKQLLVASSVNAPLKYTENKFLLLPDSSTVIMHPGSQLHYAFNGKTRDITLVGEAYFDVKHIASQPFIIHSGNVITTVLGTAFNISAYPGKKVTVSVKRGRVSVADVHNRILAVLTPDQQLVYSPETHTSNEQQVQTQKTIEWVSSDVQFSAVPFKELAEKLSVRYGVTIKFEDEALESYSITGRFSGTESLKVLLTALCETSSSAYKIDGNTVTISKINN